MSPSTPLLIFRRCETKFLEKNVIRSNFCRKSHNFPKTNESPPPPLPYLYLVPYLDRSGLVTHFDWKEECVLELVYAQFFNPIQNLQFLTSSEKLQR